MQRCHRDVGNDSIFASLCLISFGEFFRLLHRVWVIEYTPGSERATRDRITAIHLRAYSRRYKILSYEVFDDFVPALPAPVAG